MYRTIICAAAAMLLLAACNDDSKKIPPGQSSASIINNPRTADGVDEKEVAELPVLTFPDTTHDFGMMKEGEKAEHEFIFKNTGRSPLIIAGATSTCGCTAPSFTHEPVPPGGTGSIKVVFSSAGKHGHVVKPVTVTSNAYPASKVVTISADVEAQAGQ
jgi:hypothetical protein